MKTLLFVVATVVGLPLFAETFVLKEAPSTLADWTNASFYTNSVAPTGASSDSIMVKAGVTVTISSKSTDVLAFLNGIANLYPVRAISTNSPIARIIFDVDEDDEIAYGSMLASESDGTYSYIQKKGKGKLYLNHTDNNAYVSRWIVSEGELWLPPPPDNSKNYYKYYGPVAIEREGVVRTDRCLGSKSVWQPSGLYIDGILKNGATTDATTIYLTYDWNVAPTNMTFDGKVMGKIYFDCRSSKLTLLGGESDFSSTIFLDGNSAYGNRLSEVMVAKFGNKSDATSSLGTAAPAAYMGGNVGGRLIYAGKGETTDKSIRAIAGGKDSVAISEINGGEHGGLRLIGSFTKYDTSTCWNPHIVFGGDHTNACEFAGGNEDFTFSYGSAPYTGRRYARYIKKDGKGEWHFPANANYTSGGTIEVADGTFSFDLIDVVGRLCSFGRSNLCYDWSAAQPTDDKKVPYAILLGGETDAQTGIFECRTNVVQQCTDRPFGLKGRGGFRANCAAVRYANVSAVVNKETTLVLDGTNGVENTVCDVSDGDCDGSVSVEKNGSNTWVLGGDQTFTGSLKVNGGKLVVRRPAQKYQRYRLLIKEIVDNNTNILAKTTQEHGNFNTIAMCEVGLWDANNRRVNLNLAYNPDRLTLQPGQCAWGWSLKPGASDVALRTELLFDGNRYTSAESTVGKIWGAIPSMSFQAFGEGNNNAGATLDKPLTWIPLDMYLADGENPVDHFDVLSGDSCPTATGIPDRNVPSSFQLQASVDGIHWDDVSDVQTLYDSNEKYNTRYYWLSNFSSGSGANGSKDGGYMRRDDSTLWNSADAAFFNRSAGWKVTNSVPNKVFSLLPAVGPVTVANGATLKYEGAADGAPTLSQVKLASGATGTIDGFAFAETGTFEIDAMAQGSVNVAVALPNAQDLGNVSGWQVKVGGALKPSYRVSASAAGFTVVKSGLSLIIR